MVEKGCGEVWTGRPEDEKWGRLGAGITGRAVFDKEREFLDKTEYSNLFLYFSPFFFFFPFSVALGKEFSLVMPMALLLGISWKT